LCFWWAIFVDCDVRLNSHGSGEINRSSVTSPFHWLNNPDRKKSTSVSFPGIYTWKQINDYNNNNNNEYDNIIIGGTHSYACLVLYNFRLLSSRDKTTIKYYIRTPVVTVWWAVCACDYSDCSRVFLSLDLW